MGPKFFTKRDAGLHVLFGAALLSLAALAAWWSLFITRSVEESHETALSILYLKAALAAAQGSVPRGSGLEISPCSENPLSREYRMEGGNCVKPAGEAIEHIEREHDSKRLMITGESALLLLLLGVISFMLYWSVLSERRFRRELDAFFRTMTHELKTPLAGLKAFLQSIELERIDPSAAKDMSALAVKEVDRLEHLVENILFASRLRRGRPGMEPRKIDLCAFVSSLVEHRKLSGTAGQDIQVVQGPCTGKAAGVEVHASPDALRVILDNLLDNAVKYGDGSKIRLIIEEKEGLIEVAVEDDGPGFPAEEAENLFKAYRRGNRQQGLADHGTGLGLYLARSLARRMGGDLVAESKGPGRGSRFILTLKEAVK